MKTAKMILAIRTAEFAKKTLAALLALVLVFSSTSVQASAAGIGVSFAIGGEAILGGNTVKFNPLYFPQTAELTVGESAVFSMAVTVIPAIQQGGGFAGYGMETLAPTMPPVLPEVQTPPAEETGDEDYDYEDEGEYENGYKYEAYNEPGEPSYPAGTNPVEPTDPVDPTEPVEPSEPTAPTDPESPSETISPDEPTAPVDPPEPTTPAYPTEPSSPAEPTEPVEPTEPTSQPDPTEPTTPDEAGDNIPECSEESTGSLLGNLGAALGLVPLTVHAAEPWKIDSQLELLWYQNGVRRNDKGSITIDQWQFGQPIRAELRFDEITAEDAGMWTLRAYMGWEWVESSYWLDLETQTTVPTVLDGSIEPSSIPMPANFVVILASDGTFRQGVSNGTDITLEINAMGASFSSGVLTLNNFSFETSAGNVVNLASGLGNVEIVLVGNNYIATTSAMVGSIALVLNNSITINGTGTLNVSTLAEFSSAIDGLSGASITINSGSVIATGAISPSPTINGGTLIQNSNVIGGSVSGANITLPNVTLTYNNSPQTPTPTVEMGGIIVASANYNVSHSDNTNAGQATVTVTGITANNFVGTATANFTINRAAGGAVQAASTTADVTHNTITVNAAVLAPVPSSPQTIEYGISTSNATQPTSWQSGLTFTGLASNTQYFVWARSAQNQNRYAGSAAVSSGITTHGDALSITHNGRQHNWQSPQEVIFSPLFAGFNQASADEVAITFDAENIHPTAEIIDFGAFVDNSNFTVGDFSANLPYGFEFPVTPESGLTRGLHP